MPLKNSKRKVLEPLTEKDIRRVFFDKGVKVAAWARELSKKYSELEGRPVTIWPSDVFAVISRKPGYVFPTIKKELAEFCGCDESQIGNEPRRKPAEQAEQEAAA